MQSDTLTVVSTVITAAATVTIAIFAIKQTRIFRRQWKVMSRQLSEMKATSEQTKQAADAAQKSADALVNSERAWVMVDVGVPRIANATESDGAGGARYHITVSSTLSCKNDGRTPAWVVNLLAGIKIVHDLSFLPNVPNTGGMTVIQQGYEPLGVNVRTDRDCDIGCWLDRTEREGDLIVLCGVVQYRDALSDNDHETYFGFTVGKMTDTLTGRRVDESQRIPHTAYNRAT